MNRKNIKSLRPVNKRLDYNEKLILVRDGVFNYLQFLPTSIKKFVINPMITAKPVIIIKDDTPQKVILDYSAANSFNKELVQILFNNFVQGDTFGVSNAHYINPITGEDVEIETTLEFLSFKDLIITAENAGTTLTVPTTYYYDPVYFIDSPKINVVKTTGISSDPLNQINELKNSIPVGRSNNLLKNLAIEAGNYIKIINSNSANTEILFRVVSFKQDQHEYLTLDPAPTFENLIGEPTLVKVFSVSNRPEAISGITFSNQTGCGVVRSKGQVYLFDNVSNLQIAIKAQEYQDSTFEFYPDSVCTAIDTAPVALQLTAQNEVVPEIVNTTISVFVVDAAFYPVVINIAQNTNVPIYDQSTRTFNLYGNTPFDFVQEDQTNTGNTFRLSLTSNGQQAALTTVNGVTSVTTETGVGSKVTLDPIKFVQTTGTNTLYAFSEQNPGYGFTILLNEVSVFRNGGTAL
jgi:hypothetical protein